jgi:hypothetical protein
MKTRADRGVVNDSAARIFFGTWTIDAGINASRVFAGFGKVAVRAAQTFRSTIWW